MQVLEILFVVRISKELISRRHASFYQDFTLLKLKLHFCSVYSKVAFHKSVSEYLTATYYVMKFFYFNSYIIFGRVSNFTWNSILSEKIKPDEYIIPFRNLFCASNRSDGWFSQKASIRSNLRKLQKSLSTIRDNITTGNTKTVLRLRIYNFVRPKSDFRLPDVSKGKNMWPDK